MLPFETVEATFEFIFTIDFLPVLPETLFDDLVRLLTVV